MSMSWSEMDKESRVEAIKLAWQIAPSASGIASNIRGASRNAIIGTYNRNREALKAFPLGNYRIPYNSSDPNKPQAPKKYKTGHSKPIMPRPEKPKPEPKIEIIFESRDVSLEDLNRNECKWPTGEKPWRFCGVTAHNGSSWCEHHHRLAFQQRSN